MEAHFKKARLITMVMMITVLFYGVIAFVVSDQHGYGASSEAKMNFMRLIMFVFSATQIALALMIRKMAGIMSKKANPSRRLTLQIMMNAFCEAIALFGLVLVFMSKTFMDYAVFAVISLAAFVFFFPKPKDWENESDQQGQVFTQ